MYNAGTCTACGKHVMKRWSGNMKMFIGYVHYDHTTVCKGGYNDDREMAARLEPATSEPVLLGEYDPRNHRVPINAIPCCLDHSKGRERCRT